MNCMNCGCYIEVGNDFCVNCGSQVVDDTVLDDRGNPREMALTVMKSPLYLIMGISWVLCALLFLINSIISINQASKLSFLEIGSAGTFWLTIGSLIIGVPILLSAIGFLVSAIKARVGSSSGIGVAKAGFVVSLVFFSVFAAIFAVLVFILLVQILGFESYSFYGIRFMSSLDESSVAVFWISLSIIIGLLVMAFVYYSKIMSSIGVVQTAVDQNKCYRKTSPYAAVMCFFWGAAPMFTAISLFETLGSGGILFALFLIAYSVSLMLLGVNIFAFRKIDVFYGTDKLYKRPVVDEGPALMAAVAEDSVSYCIHCGRTVHGSERCICGGEDVHATKPKPPMYEPDSSGKIVNYCIRCGKTLYGTESCDCTDVSDKSPVMGGLRSTMRTPRDSGESSHTTRTSTNGFFDHGGDLN